MAPIQSNKEYLLSSSKVHDSAELKEILSQNSARMPICENIHFKAEKYNTLECSAGRYPPSRVSNFKKTNKTPSKVYRPKDNDFYSIITFYDSIPDYRDVNHLSEYEFQNQLLMLKQRQCEIFPDKSDRSVRKSEISDIHCDSLTVSSRKNTDLDIDFAGLITKNDELNNSLNSCLGNNMPAKPISRAKSNYGNNGAKCYRSKSVSPSRLTVPHPFKMTLREEKEHTMNELLSDRQHLFENDKELDDETKLSTTHSIPLTSRIPLYDRIVAEKAHKSELAKLNSAIELQSQMKPFRFSERPICHLKRSHTSPQLTTPNSRSKNDCFRAKPCPKNLFSNYFYHKMWEDEYFRALNRKLRAEELLKISSLPPSMKKRDKDSPKSEKSSASSVKRGKKRKKGTKGKSNNDIKGNEFITTSPNPFKFETEKRSTTRCSKSPTYCISNITSSKSSPIPIYPSARPNLAANLRIEWARKKLSELSIKSEKNEPKESTRRSSWGIRKSPGWKSLYFDHTNDEDISLRLATRRAEQKLHHEEHQLKMEIMRQRVRAAPLLLEGPSHWGPRTVAHDCRYGKSFGDDKVNRPGSSNTSLTHFSGFLNKKMETKRKRDSKADFHCDKK